jgi:hypothetical protein
VGVKYNAILPYINRADQYNNGSSCLIHLILSIPSPATGDCFFSSLVVTMAASIDVESPRTDVEMQGLQERGSPSQGKHDMDFLATEKGGNESDSTDEIKQDGVKQVEAVTQVWTRTAMWAVFAL